MIYLFSRKEKGKLLILIVFLSFFIFISFISASSNFFAYNKEPIANVNITSNHSSVINNNYYTNTYNTYDITKGVNLTQMDNITVININESWLDTLFTRTSSLGALVVSLVGNWTLDKTDVYNIFNLLSQNNTNTNLRIDSINSSGSSMNYSSATFNMSNSTWDNSWVNLWAYNQTQPAIDILNSTYGRWWFNQTAGLSFIDTNCSGGNCAGIIYWNNQSILNFTNQINSINQTISDSNASWLLDANDTLRVNVLNSTITDSNASWLSTYNSTYNSYNSSGLIKDYNSTGLIKDWNSTGYIINWNISGLIKDYNSTGLIKDYNSTGLIINHTSILLGLVYTKSQVDNNFSLYYLLTNPSNYLNSTTIYNKTQIDTNLSLYVLQGSSNQTYVSCSNITGTTSNLCTLTSGSASYTNLAWLNQSNTFSLNLNITGNLNMTGDILYRSLNVSDYVVNGNVTASLIANKTFLQNFTLANIQAFLNNTNNYFSSLGIGTAIPSYPIDIQKSGGVFLNINSTVGANYNAIQLKNNGGSSQIGIVGSNGIAFLTSGEIPFSLVLSPASGNSIQFGTDQKARMIINSSSGYVGIGTTSPSQLLEIVENQNGVTAINLSNNNSGSNSRSKIYMESNNTLIGTLVAASTSGIFGIVADSNNNGEIAFSTRTGGIYIERVRINNSGNVGIGTTSPAYLLEITKSATAMNVSGLLYVNSTNVGIGTTASIPKALLDVGGTVANGGLIVMGKNLDPAATPYDLNSSLNNTGKMLIGWNRQAGNGEVDLISNRGAGSSGGFNFYDFAQSGVLSSLMTIQGGGNVGIGTTSPAYLLEITKSATALNVSGNLYVNSSLVGIGTTAVSSESNLALGNKSSTEGGQLQLNGNGSYSATHIDNFLGNFRIMNGSNTASINVLFMINETNGYVGIGTSTPSPISMLTINGSIPAMTLINSGTIGSRFDLYASTSSFQITNGAQTFMTIVNSSGNVGIGTTAPNTLLNMNGTLNVTNGDIWQNGVNLSANLGGTLAQIGTTYNATASIIANLTFLQNFTTASIGSFYNSTTNLLASSVFNTTLKINWTLANAQGLYNNTPHYASSITVGVAKSNASDALYVQGNVTISSIFRLSINNGTNGGGPLIACGPAFNGSIMRNNSGVYVCGNTASAWKLL